MFKATIQIGAQLFFWGVCGALGWYGTKYAFDCAEAKLIK